MKKNLYLANAFLLSLLVLIPLTAVRQPQGPNAISTLKAISNSGNDVNLYPDPYDQHEPTIAVNPKNPLNLAAGSNDESNAKPADTTAWAIAYRSLDGGSTWFQSYVPHTGPIESFTETGDAVVDFDGFGTAFYAGDALMRHGMYDGSIWVARSTDGGLTYSSPIIVKEGHGNLGIPFFEFNDKPWIAVDKRTTGTGAGYVYETWTSSVDVNGDGLTDTRHIFLSVSTDGGTTFSTPLKVSDAGNTANQLTQVATGPNGEVYVSWINGNNPTTRVLFDKSIDYGASFETDIVVQSFNQIPNLKYISRTLPSISMAVDTSTGTYNGFIYIAYPSDPPSPTDCSDMMLTHSTNGGNSWSTPIRLNDDNTSNDQFFPSIVVNPLGSIKAAWYDRRLDPSNRYIDVFQTESNNAGSTFTANTRVTDVSFDPAGAFIGDHIDIDASSTQVYPIWTDRRNENNDVYTEYAPQGHELSVSREAPAILEPGDPTKLNATVYNIGSINETNVQLRLLINGTVINSVTITELSTGASYTLGQLWIPTIEGIYNITAYAPPVPSEVLISNNAAYRSVQVSFLPDILVVADDDASRCIIGTSLLEFESALATTDYDYWEWKESIKGHPSLAFLLKFRLVIWTSGDFEGWAVDPTDASTLKTYLNQGGSILLEGEDIGYDHGSDSFMLNTAHAIYQIDDTEALGLTITNANHPVTQGLPKSFTWLIIPPAADGVTPTNGAFEVIGYTGTTWTAATVSDGTGTSNGSVVYYAFSIYSLGQPERDTLIINSVSWLRPQVHDVAVISVTPSKTVVGQGCSVSINVTLENQGDYTESLTVTTYANTTTIETQAINNLPNRAHTTITFTWNTIDAVHSNYTISAFAPPVQGEKDTADNTRNYMSGTVLITIPGDVNGDKIVDVLDLFALSRAYSSTPKDSSWNANADINNDLIVNKLDLDVLNKNYGKSP